MAEIKLTQNQVAIVDDEDFARLSKFKWHAGWQWQGKLFYAVRSAPQDDDGKQSKIIMHREIMDAPAGLVVDHINHDTLDNRKCNLRICTQSENSMNRKGAKRNSKSGIRGVSWDKNRNKWHVMIGANKKMMHVGYFNEVDAAADAAKLAILKYHGRFANI